MIAKLTTGNGFSGAGRYDLRIGTKEQGQGKILGLSGVDYAIDENGNYVVDHIQVGKDFRLQAMMYPTVRKPVYHWALSWKIGEEITDELMKQSAEEFLEGIGFDNTQYIIIRHQKENQHCHIISNIVDNDGNRIPTSEQIEVNGKKVRRLLIEKAHAVARDITISHNFAWGETAKKETIEKAHKPHEKARYTIEPTVKAAVAQAKNIEEIPGLLKPSGIGCNIKYSEAGKPVGISFSVELDSQLHTFKGSDLDRSLSAGNIVKSIDARIAQEEASRIAEQQELVRQKPDIEKKRDMIAGSNSILPMFRGKISMVSVRNNTYQLMKAVTDAGVTVSKETTAKFGEMKGTWKKFDRLNHEARTTKDAADMTKALGGLLMLLNPIIGLTVMFLASVSNDIRQAKITAQKKQLLARIESIRSEISQLQEQKAQLKIEKQERVQEYFDAKRMLKEYNENLRSIDKTIYDARVDMEIQPDGKIPFNQQRPEAEEPDIQKPANQPKPKPHLSAIQHQKPKQKSSKKKGMKL